jgi:hypothetical protein
MNVYFGGTLFVVFFLCLGIASSRQARRQD